MGFDLYLLPAKSIEHNLDSARRFLDEENERFHEIPAQLDAEAEARKRKLADVILRMKPEYREFAIDHAAIAAFESIEICEATTKYRYIEINAPEEKFEAQYTFYDRHAVIHWYGMAIDDLTTILYVLAVTGDYVVYDPQSGSVYDPRIDEE